MSSARTTSIQPQPAPVIFNPSMETPEPDERAVDAQIVETLGKISETTLSHNPAKPLRSVHAKCHGLLHANLTIASGLPAVLAQGLFARAATYDVIMRLSTTPGDLLEDSISTPRGLAVKVLGVPGERVAGDEAGTSQDFVLVNGPAFGAPNAAGFLKTLKLLEPTTDRLEPVKKLTSAIARGAEAVLEAAGTKNATLTSLGGHPETNILGESFYSQAPFLYGPYIAKFGVFPVSASLTALTGGAIINNGEPNFLRNQVVEFFMDNYAVWELRVQLCTDLETMPVEDASAIWPEAQSHYLTVATITAGRQDAWTAQKIAALDAGLAFSPWHALAAHRPLGAVNRARKSAYASSAKFRADHQTQKIADPQSLNALGL